MRKKRIFLSFLLLVLLGALTACHPGSSHSDTTPMGEAGTWSIYLYLCGSNLETKTGAAGKNLDEILAADIPSNVNIIIETGGSTIWRSHDIPEDSLNRYVVKDGKLSLLETLPQGNMGDEKTFRDFLSYGVKKYPAEKMAVIVWDHGSGSIDGVANDENYSFDSLSLKELGGALNAVSKSMTDKFEMFGFDACLMANLETASTLEPYARYMIASEEIEPSGGWDYNSLFQAIQKDEDITGDKVGKAVCDGYFSKCKKKDKDATVTLSVTDLSKMKNVRNAFDTLATQMKKDSVQAKGIQTFATGAKNAQKFGGTTASEGYSNLIDLNHFAENITEVESAKSLSTALKAAVLYQVKGAQKSNSGGLSFYYPSYVEEEKLSTYCKEICPSSTYRDYLKQVYENIPKNPITFTDYGSKAKDDSYQIQIDKKSKNYILSIDYILVEYEKTKKKGSVKIDATWLGQDNDLSTDKEELTYYSNFRGIWLNLNGCELFAKPVEDTTEYVIFAAPILLNGKKTNLRFAYIWDDSNPNGGYYQIIGAWNGLDQITGMSDKEITKLKPTDEIQTFYYYQSATIHPDGTETGSGSMEEKLRSVPKGEYQITEEPLSKSDYAYQFVVTDIFGGKHYSYLAHMEMTKSVEELKASPVPDGEYAGVPTKISKRTEPIIMD